jgi:hypothetical protein
MEVIQTSALFQTFKAQHPRVEVWADDGFTEGGWSYFWIVSRFDEGSVRNLAYVRLRDQQFERRTYDAAGDDVWVPAE